MNMLPGLYAAPCLEELRYLSESKSNISVRSVAICFKLEWILQSILFLFQTENGRSVSFCMQMCDVHLADSVHAYASEKISARPTCIG